MDVSRKPVVSAVIPMFNRGDKAIVAVESCLKQSFRNIEVIVVDDHSTEDMPFDRIEALDPRVKVIRLARNSGAAIARNVGAFAARGDFVAFLDADDIWLPDKLEKQLAYVERHKVPGKTFLAATNVLAGGSDVLTKVNQRPPGPNEHVADYLMLSDQMLQTSTLLVPVELARESYFNPELKRHQDWDFVLRAIHRGAALLYVDEPLTIYDMGYDARRISVHPLAFKRSVDWFRTAFDIVPKTTMQTYFVRSACGRNVVHQPYRTLHSLVNVAALHPPGIPAMIVEIAKVVASKFGVLSTKLRRAQA